MDAVPPKQLPTLTVPQWLAFATFVIFVALAFFSNKTVEPAEYTEVRILAALLIAALLPSDALIRYGRTLWAKSPTAEEVKKKDPPVTVEDAPSTTLPQILAFAAFVVTAVLILVSNSIVTKDEFGQVDQLLRVLIVALLPSEAVIRFARARYLGVADPAVVGAEHLKKI
jgi:hypothetical protein